MTKLNLEFATNSCVTQQNSVYINKSKLEYHNNTSFSKGSAVVLYILFRSATICLIIICCSQFFYSQIFSLPFERQRGCLKWFDKAVDKRNRTDQEKVYKALLLSKVIESFSNTCTAKIIHLQENSIWLLTPRTCWLIMSSFQI